MSEQRDARVDGARGGGTLVAVLLGALVSLAALSVSAVTVALPAMGADLGAGPSGTAWVVASYALTLALGTAVFGRLADLWGLRACAVLGVGLFVAGALVAAAGPSLPVVVLGRLVQGAGGGSLAVVALGVVATRFGEGARGRATGTMLAVVTVVSGAGTLVGGVLADLLSWRAVLALPIVALPMAVPLARVAPREPAARGSFDARGALLVALAVSALTFLLQSPSVGATAPVVAGAGALAALGALGTALHVARRPNGFLPRAVVSNRRFALGALTALSLQGAYFALLFAAPLLLAEGGDRGPLEIGLLLLPAAAFGAVADRVVGVLVGRANPYGIAALLAAGSVGALLVSAATAAPVLVVAAFALGITGFTAGQVALLDPIPSLVGAPERGAAVGVFNLSLNSGGAIGAAAVGGLVGVLGLPGALAVVAALPAVGVLCALAAARSDERSTQGKSRRTPKGVRGAGQKGETWR